MQAGLGLLERLTIQMRQLDRDLGGKNISMDSDMTFPSNCFDTTNTNANLKVHSCDIVTKHDFMTVRHAVSGQNTYLRLEVLCEGKATRLLRKKKEQSLQVILLSFLQIPQIGAMRLQR